MKTKHYIIFYVILSALCISQVVVILGRNGQNVSAGAQLSYLQKYKLQLEQEINQAIAVQAQQVAINQLVENDTVKSQYQPISQVLAIQETEVKAISLGVIKP